MSRKLSWILRSNRLQAGGPGHPDVARLMESLANALAEVAVTATPAAERVSLIGAKLAEVFVETAPGFLALTLNLGGQWQTTVICEPGRPSSSPTPVPPNSELPRQLFAIPQPRLINIQSAIPELPDDWSQWVTATGADEVCLFPKPFRDHGLWFCAGHGYRSVEWTSLLDFTVRLVLTATLGDQANHNHDEVLEKEFVRWSQVRDPQRLCEMFSEQLADQFDLDRSLFLYHSQDQEQPESLCARGVDVEESMALLSGIDSPEEPGRRPDSRLRVLPRPVGEAAEPTSAGEQFGYSLSVRAKNGARVVGVIGGKDKCRLSPAQERRLENWVRRFELALDNQQRIAQLEALSYTDTLTGVFNRRFFVRRLEEEITRAHRFGRSLSLVVSDLDHFKSLNDTYGHLAGDRVLREAAELLVATARSIDIVCRYGGDEFVIVMPETSLTDCFSFTDRLRNAIFEHEFRPGRGREIIRLSVSSGTAVFPEHADGPERLFWCADMALLKAKEAGGNRSLIYQPGMDNAPRLDDR